MNNNKENQPQTPRETRDLWNTRNTQAPQSPHPKNIPLPRHTERDAQEHRI